MAQGYYNVRFNDEKNDLILEVANVPGGGDIPDDQLTLSMSIANALSIVKLLYDKKPLAFKKAFEQLFYLAKTGLEGPNAQPLLASKALLQFKQEIADRESGGVKSRYLRLLGEKSLMLGLPALIIGTVLNFYFCCNRLQSCFNYDTTASLLILWSGTALGVWLSFAITRTYLTFDDLGVLEKDGLEPILRLLFTGALAIIFGLLFIKKALGLNLGGVTSDKMTTDPIIAFLLGVILGINEKIIGGVLSKKTADLIK